MSVFFFPAPFYVHSDFYTSHLSYILGVKLILRDCGLVRSKKQQRSPLLSQRGLVILVTIGESGMGLRRFR